tara:strand:+ start:3338 stop:3907 length:570 start_codon:yes stop_codon:yes gene_type:complete
MLGNILDNKQVTSSLRTAAFTGAGINISNSLFDYASNKLKDSDKAFQEAYAADPKTAKIWIDAWRNWIEIAAGATLYGVNLKRKGRKSGDLMDDAIVGIAAGMMVNGVLSLTKTPISNFAADVLKSEDNYPAVKAPEDKDSGKKPEAGIAYIPPAGQLQTQPSNIVALNGLSGGNAGSVLAMSGQSPQY